ncbi:MAG: hypothetical protein WD749_08740 [Phycisphaerales bacterium]
MTYRLPQYAPFVNRWRRPAKALLAGERHACGKPPFDPFLTASLLWTSHLCPVAAIHELLHGISLQPRLGSSFRARLRGEHWHEYIAGLRLRIAAERLQLPGDRDHAIEVIRHDFDQWVRPKHVPDPEVEAFWDDYVVPYARSQLASGSLQALVGHAILPEVSVGNWRIEVPLDHGNRAYPIEARVDEIDLTAGVMIERTTLPLAQAVLYKDVQLVAAALILRSLPAAGVPEQWAAVRRIRRFVLEAPDGSVEITPTADHFGAIHESAAIIRDLAASELAEWPIRQLAQCSPVQPHSACSHPFVACFYKVPTFPQSRAPIKRETRLLGRAQLYELMWQRDLNKYRLYERADAGEKFPALDLEFVGTGHDGQRAFIEARLTGPAPAYPKCDLIIGTPFIGVRRQSVSFDEDPITGNLRFFCDLAGLPLPNTGVLWPAINEGFLLEGRFDFLIQQLQRDLFAHHKIGTSDAQQQQQETALQLLDAIFGATPGLETGQ